MADAAHAVGIWPERLRDRSRIGFDGGFERHFAVIANDTDRGFVDRDIEAGKVFHHTTPSLPFDRSEGRAAGGNDARFLIGCGCRVGRRQRQVLAKYGGTLKIILTNCIPDARPLTFNG
ncbi:MAG: hypothetical protein ACT6Q7_22095 [Blastomonas fulva]|uniref:hypothetical protein n=1 Tax=Blastomonas fulva TaxID=1550728 RepID=UPI0040349C3D